MVPEGWLSRGEAFVSGQGRQLAVFGGIPGERARVRFVERGGPQEKARWAGPAGDPHPDRVEPPCERWAPCGRCALMHLSDPGRDRARTDVLKEAFAEARAPRPERFSIHRGAAADSAHALELVAGWSDDRHPRLGVRGRDPRRVVPIPTCIVVTPALRSVMSVVAHHMRALDVHPWVNGKGSFRGVVVRQSSVTGELALTLVYGRSTPFAKAFCEAIVNQQSGISGVFVHWNEQPGPLIAASEETGEPEVSALYGQTWREERVECLKLRLGALDPFPEQVEQGVAAWRAVVDGLAPDAGDAVVDLGAGVGARAMLLAERSGWVLGIDPRAGVVRRAKENVATAGKPVELVTAPLAEGLVAARERLQGRRPLVVVDAGPRGVEPAMGQALVELEPRRVALVCNNPKALGRDVAKLCARGYRLVSLDAFDTAPWTLFGESVAVLVSSDTRPPEKRAPQRRTVRG